MLKLFSNEEACGVGGVGRAERGMCSKLALPSLFCAVKNSTHQLCMDNITAAITSFKFIPL